MKKILSLIIIVMSVLLAACGGPSPKEEAKTLYEKYYGNDNSVILKTFDKMAKPDNIKDWSPEMLKWGKDTQAMWAEVEKQIDGEKVQKENEILKANLKKVPQAMNKLFGYAVLELDAHVNKKAMDPQAKKDGEAIVDKFDDTMSQIHYEIENEYSKISTGKPLKILGANGKNYFAYTSSDVDMAIFDISNPKVIGRNRFSQTKPLGQFIVVSIAVKNNQKDAITVDSTSFKLIDKEKREFSTSTHAMTAIQMEGGHAKGFLTQLNPGMGTDFKFAFDVPADAKNRDFKLVAKGGFSGKKVEIPLKVNYVPQVKN